jgi:hypothetical protein
MGVDKHVGIISHKNEVWGILLGMQHVDLIFTAFSFKFEYFR